MITLTYAKVKELVDNYTGIITNTDLFWGMYPITIYPPKMEKTYFRLFENIARKSTRVKPHKKDRGHLLISSDLTKIIHHFQKMKVIPLGKVEIVP